MDKGIIPTLAQVAREPDDAGERAPFERFLHQQRHALVSFLRKRVSTEEDAQDAAQESMARLLKYREATEPDAWRPLLYRIAVNVANDQARRARSRCLGDHVPYEEAFSAAASNEPTHDERVLRKQMMERLWQIIRGLPARTQEIYLLNRVEGMSYQQVARHCGITASAVEKHISRALLALRNGLGEIDPDAFQ